MTSRWVLRKLLEWAGVIFVFLIVLIFVGALVRHRNKSEESLSGMARHSLSDSLGLTNDGSRFVVTYFDALRRRDVDLLYDLKNAEIKALGRELWTRRARHALESLRPKQVSAYWSYIKEDDLKGMAQLFISVSTERDSIMSHAKERRCVAFFVKREGRWSCENDGLLDWEMMFPGAGSTPK
jgi:hypothetical protein